MARRIVSPGAGRATNGDPALSSAPASNLALKFLRLQAGLTLEGLAEASGLTRSYLSKVERGLSNPSISAALAIARALGIGVETLFGAEQSRDPIEIIRAAAGEAGDPASYLSLVAGSISSGAMRAFIVRPGHRASARTAMMSHHAGEELLFVLSGRIELRLGQRVELLGPGDCAHFDSTLPHKLAQLGDEPASALVVIADRNGPKPADP